MLVKFSIVVVLLLILGSLFSALYYLIKDKGQGERTVRALTLRISLSIGLFLVLMLGYFLGIIGHPHP
ncbi:hypothetical protein GALL_316720 [mine drainage metagenome]|uniref:Twin transmembrane helix small protein n=1 Tax=mine drainage metagenome TaxID=410659 RepID=A0A1J5QS78_9ZZZZ